MKVLLYADFRSPHAQGWKAGIEAAGISVLAVSSEAHDDSAVATPSGAIAQLRQGFVRNGGGANPVRALITKVGSFQISHSVLQLLRSSSRRNDLNRAVSEFQPDIIHALRLPYEGVTALATATAHPSIPTIVSSWGQDFVPQASSDPVLRHWIRKYLPLAAGFQYDSTADLGRARGFGLRAGVPTLHAAGNFGVDASLFFESEPTTPELVVYARKAVPSCNYFGFIEAALQLVQTTDATFVGVGLAKLLPEVIQRYGEFDQDRLQLIDELGRDEFAHLVRSASVIVSPSYSDGMPVTVLGAAASGSKIVAGDLPQLRELREQGVDIVLVDAHDSADIARGIAEQLEAPAIDAGAALPDEYSRAANSQRVPDFYRAVIAASG